MQRKKRKYKKNCYLGIKIEIPNKYVKGVNIIREYKKVFKSSCIKKFCVGKIISEDCKELLLTKSIKERTPLSNFSVLFNFGHNKKEIKRLIGIINVLGDGKILKEKVKTFIKGDSVLNLLPEFKDLNIVFNNLEQLIPNFIEVAWINAPDAIIK